MQDQKRINQLLNLIKYERSSEAIEELYDIISPTIRHIALKYLHNQSLADDLVQDFWADIYKIADKFIPFGSGRSYLCKAARNRAINRYNKIKGERAHIIYVDYSEIQVPCENEEDTELITIVNEAISELSEIEKIIIQSVYFEDKTVREIATELKISKSQVQRQKDAAIKKMQEKLLVKEKDT